MDDENEQKDTFKQSFDQVKVSRQNETQKSYDSVSNSVQSRQKVFPTRYETLPKVDNQTQRFYNFMKQTQDIIKSNKSSSQFQNVLSSEKLSKISRQSNDQVQYYNYELISSRPNHQLFFRQQQTIQNEDQQGNINSYSGIKNAIYLNQQPHQQQIFQESDSKYSYPSYISNEDNRFQNGSRFGSIYSREKRNQSKNQKIKYSFSNRPIAFKNQKLSQSNYLKSHPHYVETSQNIQGTSQINHSPFIFENEQFAIKKNKKRIGSNFNAQLNKNNYGGYVHNYEYRQDKSQNLSVNNGKDSTLAQTQIPNSMSNCSQIQKSSQIIYPSFLKGIDFSESDSPQILAQKQYETDLFEFIKKEMIRINDENVIREQEYHKKKQQYKYKQQSYLKRYKQYKEVKEENKYQIQRQSRSLQQINRQIQGFEQQLKFYRQHFFSMQTSIKTKLKTQEDYYYQHKLKLEDTIMKNNQTILQYNNQLKNIERQSTMKSNLSSLAFTRRQNKRLKEELRAEKELFIQRYKKLENQENQFQRLNRLKQKQYRELILQVEKVKKSMFRMPKT